MVVHSGYSEGTAGVQSGYKGGTLRVQWVDSQGTAGVQSGYSRGTVRVGFRAFIYFYYKSFDIHKCSARLAHFMHSASII